MTNRAEELIEKMKKNRITCQELVAQKKKYVTCSGCKGNHYQDLFGEPVLCMRCEGKDKFEEDEDEQS